MNDRRLPKLRFKGFKDDWEQRKLGEIASSFEYGLNAAAKEFDGKNKYIRITDIYDDSREFDQNNVTSPDIDLLNADSYKLTKGDILFARTGASVGKTYIYKDFDGLVYYAGFLIRAKIKDSYIPEFIFQSTLTKAYEKFIKVTSMRSGQPGVNAQEYSQFELMIPEKPEQDKIGIYFTRLDHLITLHQRKLEKLKIVKKAMLENCFPKNGEKVLKFRFSGFTGDWEQRKLGEIYARSGEKNDGSVGIDRNITVATMQFKDDVKVSTTEYLKTYYTFNVGDIAFEGHQSKEFRFGRFVENDIGNGIVSHIFAVFRPIVEYDLKFWKYAINNERLMQRVLSRSTKASTMMHDLVTDDFLNESFLVPTIEEQRKIGDYFSHLDHLITLHQRKLEKLKIIKKSFLEKMFV